MKPAELLDVQLTFEDGLVGELLFEVQRQAGALPLLQFTLYQLFQQRDGHLLTLDAYHNIGGVGGALAKHAESTYTEVLPSEEHRQLARVLFLRLIDPGQSEQDTTRRRATLKELSFPDPTQTQILHETANIFITERLLVTNEVAGTPTLEVSHEALIREWPRLRDWLITYRSDILTQEAISNDAAKWLERSRPSDRLYRDTELAEAQAWMKRNVPNKNEVDFIQASIAQQEQEQAEYALREAERAQQAKKLELLEAERAQQVKELELREAERAGRTPLTGGKKSGGT